MILGLGGGTVAKILQKTWPKIKITGVDIDPVMVDLGKKYLGLENVKDKIGDAYNFDTKGFDLVVVDLYRGDVFPKKFEDEKFLKKLVNNKLVIFNRLYYGDKRPMAVRFGLKLQKVFKKVKYYYPEANLMFICSGSSFVGIVLGNGVGWALLLVFALTGPIPFGSSETYPRLRCSLFSFFSLLLPSL